MKPLICVSDISSVTPKKCVTEVDAYNLSPLFILTSAHTLHTRKHFLFDPKNMDKLSTELHAMIAQTLSPSPLDLYSFSLVNRYYSTVASPILKGELDAMLASVSTPPWRTQRNKRIGEVRPRHLLTDYVLSIEYLPSEIQKWAVSQTLPKKPFTIKIPYEEVVVPCYESPLPMFKHGSPYDVKKWWKKICQHKAANICMGDVFDKDPAGAMYLLWGVWPEFTIDWELDELEADWGEQGALRISTIEIDEEIAFRDAVTERQRKNPRRSTRLAEKEAIMGAMKV